MDARPEIFNKTTLGTLPLILIISEELFSILDQISDMAAAMSKCLQTRMALGATFNCQISKTLKEGLFLVNRN